MNKVNLQKMADYIKTIPQELFDIKRYRESDNDFDFTSQKCNTIGCIIGHCTILDDIKNIPFDNGKIDFTEWSYNFTGLYYYDDEWEWCFSHSWKDIDNTPIGASKRIEYLLNYGLPINHERQISGLDPLCYLKK